MSHPSKSNEELIQEYRQKFGLCNEDGKCDCDREIRWLRTILQAKDAERERAVEDIIKMSDALELECGKDGDKGTKQWMAFKGFRNTIRDKYLTPITPNPTHHE